MGAAKMQYAGYTACFCVLYQNYRSRLSLPCESLQLMALHQVAVCSWVMTGFSGACVTVLTAMSSTFTKLAILESVPAGQRAKFSDQHFCILLAGDHAALPCVM